MKLLAIAFIGLSACLAKPTKYEGSGLDQETSIPKPPRNLQVEFAKGELLVSWEAAKGASSYNLYWSNEKKFHKKNARRVERLPRQSHRLMNVDRQLNYFFAVAGVGSGGEGELSAVKEFLAAVEGPTQESGVGSLYGLTVSGDGQTIAYVKPFCHEALNCVMVQTRKDENWSEASEALAFHIDSKHRGPSLHLDQNGQKLIYSNDEGIYLASFKTNIWESKQVAKPADSGAVDASQNLARIAWIFNEFLYVLDLDNGTAKGEAKKLGRATSFDLSDDGTLIVFERAGVKLLSLSGNNWNESSLGPGRRPKFRRDGATIVAFTDTRTVVSYRRDGSRWSVTEKEIKDCCTTEIAMSHDGNYILSGSSIAKWKDNNWAWQFSLPEPPTSGEFSGTGSQLFFTTATSAYATENMAGYWSKPQKL